MEKKCSKKFQQPIREEAWNNNQALQYSVAAGNQRMTPKEPENILSQGYVPS